MFVSNPSDQHPKDQEMREFTPKQPKSRFANVEQFAEWLDKELASLIQDYRGFETSASLAGNFGRS